MQDETPCSLFVRESAAERDAVVGPFLTTMRGGDNPSAKLTRELAGETLAQCKYSLDSDDPKDYTVGVTVLAIMNDKDTRKHYTK